jgi:hypothetical protein
MKWLVGQVAVDQVAVGQVSATQIGQRFIIGKFISAGMLFAHSYLKMIFIIIIYNFFIFLTEGSFG